MKKTKANYLDEQLAAQKAELEALREVYFKALDARMWAHLGQAKDEEEALAKLDDALREAGKLTKNFSSF